MTNLSIVIPLYNEEKRLPATLNKLNRWNAPSTVKIDEIIFVNDGSSDRSAQIIKSTPLKFSSRLISYRINKGKGYAVKVGMLSSNSSYTLLLDADLSTPLSQINKLTPHFNQSFDVIIGTRKNSHSNVVIHQPKIRENLGKIFTRLSQLILGIEVTDFTCGFKAFSKRSKELIFKQAKINRWAYDSEILLLSHLYGFSRVEQAVTWSDSRGTKVNLFFDSIISLIELLKIKYFQLRNYYGVTSALSKPILKLSN